MKNTKTWIIILTVIATLTFFNLKNYYDYYGKNYNNEREKIGVLKIPKTWRTKERGTKTKLCEMELKNRTIKFDNFKSDEKTRIKKAQVSQI